MTTCMPLWALAWALAGCVSGPDFSEPSLVDRPRVLAVVADPPEVAPGEGSELSVLLAGFDDEPFEVTWTACGAFSTMVGGAQFDDQDRQAGCAGEFAVPLGTGMRATLPGAATATLFDNLDVVQAVLGGELPIDVGGVVRDQVGISLTVELQVETENRVYRATKAVIVNQARQHTNPPLPRFSIDGTGLEASSDDPFRCVTDDGRAPSVTAGEEVTLAPFVSGEEEAWLEPYRVLTLQGEVEDRDERAFYSWYADAGEMTEEITKSPLRNNLWRTPGEPGCHRLWLVVRDGHGGTSACTTPVAVGDEDICGDP